MSEEEDWSYFTRINYQRRRYCSDCSSLTALRKKQGIDIIR
jgi:hypothetical protein